MADEILLAFIQTGRRLPSLLFKLNMVQQQYGSAKPMPLILVECCCFVNHQTLQRPNSSQSPIHFRISGHFTQTPMQLDIYNYCIFSRDQTQKDGRLLPFIQRNSFVSLNEGFLQIHRARWSATFSSQVPFSRTRILELA